MRFASTILLALGTSLATAASWGFEDATVLVKGKSVEGVNKEKIIPGQAISKPLVLATGQTLKIVLTATNGGKARRPHQAFLTIVDSTSKLEESYPFTIKDSGKATVDLTHNVIPASLLTTSAPLKASIVIGSFGSSTPYKGDAFDLFISHDPNLPQPQHEAPVRYGKQPEIHHTFRADAKSPPKLVTLVFLGAVLATIPILLGGWVALGANLSHLTKALNAAPVSHILFVGSVFAMEGVFFLYYTNWNLFKTLPVATAIAAVTFVSGSKALTEVQERRLAGLR